MHFKFPSFHFAFRFISFQFFTGSLPSSERLAIRNIYDLDNKLTGVKYSISGAVVADSGAYECKATNKHETVTKQVTINVQAGSPPGEVPA